MYIIHKIAQKIDYSYRHYIAKEQYPMLTFFSRRCLNKDGAIGLVYMLHHVCEKNPKLIPTNEDLKVSPAFLEKIICQYKEQGFDFLSLDELYTITQNSRTSTKPFVIFTLDDGYLDNYTQALPVFEKFQVPFAIFVATDFIDKKAILWWDSIEELIMTHDKITTSDGITYPCTTFQQRWDSFRYLRERILNLDQSRLEEELKRLFDGYDIDWYEPIRKNGMTWEQVKKLATHPLCTIGGHTVSHPALNKLSEEKAKWEVSKGIEMIEQSIHKPVRFFAYPYGTPNEIGDREFFIVKEQGLQLSFMAHQGCITEVNLSYVTHLPRVYLKE